MTSSQRSACVLTLGNFDGVHRGHQHVLACARERADSLGVPLVALTFEPHPRQFFRPHDPPFRLTDGALRERFLREAGAEAVSVLPFTEAFSQQSPQTFIEYTLLEQYRACAVVTGYDFLFGSQRQGTTDLLKDALGTAGVPFFTVAPYQDDQGGVVSSSRIRQALRDSDVQTAMNLLGRPFVLRGRVQKGDGRGRTLGFPTANIDPQGFLMPRYGVYAVRVRRTTDSLTLAGVANIGVRPTVTHDQNTSSPLLECHLLTQDALSVGEGYGELWEVSLMRFLRPEQKFESIDALRAQIGRDCEAAKSH